MTAIDLFYAWLSVVSHITLSIVAFATVFFGFAPTALSRCISWLYTYRIWGSRCPDDQPGCHGCDAWAMHDWLFNDGLT